MLSKNSRKNSTKIRKVTAVLLILSLLFAAPSFAAGGQGDGGVSPQVADPAHPAVLGDVYIGGFIAGASTAAINSSDSGYISPAADESPINDEHYALRREWQVSALAAPPASYDARDVSGKSYVSNVKNQSVYGCCWAFSSLASAEGSLVKNGIAKTPPKLSPYHNVFSVYNGFTFAAAPDTFSGAMNGGGNDYYAVAAMSKWFGPLAWTADDTGLFPTHYPDGAAPEEPPSPIDTNSWEDVSVSQYHLQDALYFPSPRDSDGAYDPDNVNEIKNAIMQYGPLSTSFYDDEDYFTPDTMDGPNCAYFYPGAYGSQDADHAVTIVGWNDSFSKTNFSESGTAPKANGAWLIKNSWGSNWGNDGYFWLSYYDPTIGTSTYYNMVADNNYDNQFYYDDLGFIGCAVGYDADNEYMANVFEVAPGAGVQLLSAASINSVYPGTSYVISAYQNPDPDNPTSGTKLDISSGSSESVAVTEAYAGYHTVPFTKSAALNPGDTFSIVVEVDKLEEDDYSMTLECTLEAGDGEDDPPLISAGQSFFSEDGENWDDLEDGINPGVGNFCIRAFTTGSEIAGIAFSGTQPQVLKQGQTVDLSEFNLSVTYSDDRTEIIPMSTSGVSVQKIDTSKTGTQTVGVTYGGHSASFTVDVIPWVWPAKITVTGAPKTYQYKSAAKTHTVQLKAKVMPAGASDKSLTWSVTGPAKINAKGLLTFNGKEGTVRVVAESQDKPQILTTVKINAVKHVTGIRTPLSTIYLKRGTTYKLPLVVSDGDRAISAGLTYKPANTKVVTVSKGKLKASSKLKKKTKTTVTIKAANGVSKKITVYVVPSSKAVKSFSVSGVPKTMKAKNTKQLTVRIKTPSATNVKVSYASSKSSVLSVDKAGKLTAKKKGTAYITVKAGSKKIKKLIRVT